MHKFRQYKQATPAECPGYVCLYLCDVLSQGEAAQGPFLSLTHSFNVQGQVYCAPFVMDFMDYNLFSF